MTKRISAVLFAAAMLIAGCGANEVKDEPEEEVNEEIQEIFPEESEEPLNEEEDSEMILRIENEEINVVWEDIESVNALKNLVSENELTISMHMYGGWEQVGEIGASLPRNDVQTTAKPGDIMLYSGDQIVVFYGNNSWAYTKLGRMDGYSQAELEEMLGNGNVTLTITME
ncbi:MAG: hypothetical protein IKG55_09690 [Solobacterium sp.]|nr:hypothetical protein [Solobacterium sp.]